MEDPLGALATITTTMEELAMVIAVIITEADFLVEALAIIMVEEYSPSTLYTQKATPIRPTSTDIRATPAMIIQVIITITPPITPIMSQEPCPEIQDLDAKL